jgi:hypothetical protein
MATVYLPPDLAGIARDFEERGRWVRAMQARIDEFERRRFPADWVPVEITTGVPQQVAPIPAPRTALERSIVSSVERDGMPVHGQKRKFCEAIRKDTGLPVSDRTVARHMGKLFRQP